MQKKYQNDAVYVVLHLIRRKMDGITISNAEWEKIRIKVRRKYNDLSDHDLAYVAGEEDRLIGDLSARINQAPSYVIFMLNKMKVNIDNNRL